MICRHKAGDPDCGRNAREASAYSGAAVRAELDRLRAQLASPDAERFVIEDVERVHAHLVIKVRYPNCAKCAYEGVKVLVFLHVTEKMAISWRSIDPHFRKSGALTVGQAPSPAARFPASEEGWKDALAYAATK